MEEKLIWQTRNEMNAPTNPLQSLRESYCRSAKDMGEDKFDAWVYGIIVGWGDECYPELSLKHNWSKETVEYNKRLHKNYCKTWNLFMNDKKQNDESTRGRTTVPGIMRYTERHK